MIYFTGSLGSAADHAHSGWMMRAVWESSIEATHHFVSLMRQSAAHERARRELMELDTRMLRDVGLEPFDVYYGGRHLGRAGR